MVNVNDFIEKQNHGCFYAFVTYDGHTEPTYFYSVDLGEDGLCDLHSVCTAYKIVEGAEKIEEYFNALIAEGSYTRKFIDEYCRPCIVDNTLYEMENFQYSPYLPEEVDEIKICSERDCLLFCIKSIK